MATATLPPTQTLGVIRDDEAYPLPVFMKVAGLSQWAMRQARRNGLKIRRQGKRAFVLGRDWSAYLAGLES